MMKVSITTFAVVSMSLAAAGVFAQGAGKPAERKPTKAERMGGIVQETPPPGAKAIVLLDCRADKSKLTQKAFLSKPCGSTLYTKVVEGDLDSYRNDNGDFVLALVDEGTLSVDVGKRMAIVPKEAFDTKTVKKLESALVALFALCGNDVPDMSAVMLLKNCSKPLNVPALRKAQYIVAVREGWAPPPTNDVQRAIWESVKTEKSAAAATNAPAATPPAK